MGRDQVTQERGHSPEFPVLGRPVPGGYMARGPGTPAAC